MNGILELLKNARVEWKTLGEVCIRQKGIHITARQMKELNKEGSSIKVFAGGDTVAYIDDVVDVAIKIPSVIVKSRGNVDFEFYDKPFTHKNELWSYSSRDEKCLNVKFLYYYLKNNVKYFKDIASITGTMPQISVGSTDNFNIPIPPIELQKEIVRILDTFSELIAELQAELQAELILRQKQYEYYGEYLIFNAQFKIVKLKDICTVNQGLQLPINKRYKESGKNRYRYITIQFLKEKNDKQFYIENPNSNVLCNKDDILVTRTGNTGDIITGVEGCFHNNFFKVNCNELVVKRYLYYVLKSGKVNKRLKELASKGTVPDLPHNKFYELEIPLPSIEEQKKIVTMLDKFSEIANDLERGLPAEIDLRQKQYEYYRNLLLSFPNQN